MNIVLFLASVGLGGVEKTANILSKEWLKRGHNVSVWVSINDTKAFSHFHSDIKIEALDIIWDSHNPWQRFINTIKRVIKLRSRGRQEKCDIIIACGCTEIFLARLACIGLKARAVFRDGNNPHYRHIQGIKPAWLNFLHRISPTLIVQTKACYQGHSRAIQKHTCIIPNPVLGDFSSAKPDQALSSGRFHITAIGRLNQVKGFDTLIKAWAECTKKFPDWDLYIWGEGSERQSLESLCQNLDLTSCTFLPGATKEIAKELCKSHLFVLSSHYEGFPNVLCEAMASGLPVIACDCPYGPNEIIEDKKNGILVPTNDCKTLANAMQQLMQNPKKRNRMGKEAQKISHRFRVEKIMELWDKKVLCP